MSNTILTELTQKQEALTDVVVKKYMEIVEKPRGGMELTADDPDIVNVVKLIYRCCDKAAPKDIRIVDSIRAANRLADTLLDPGYTASPNGCLVAEVAWVARYDYYHLIQVLSDSEYADTQTIERALFKVWDCVLLDECAILVRHPTEIHRDEQGRPHRKDGPAIVWKSCCEYKDRPGVVIPGEYVWHGVIVNQQIIEAPETVTPEQYAALNADQKRAFGERFGWANVADMLKAKAVESAVIDGLEYELLAADNGERWLKMQSPILKDGSQPYHVEKTHEDIRTVAGARKWRVAYDPIRDYWWTPEECEEDPSLVVGQHA